MNKLFLIMALLLPSAALAASVGLTWDINTEPEVTGYKVYYGNYSGNTIKFVSVGSALVSAPPYTVTGLDSLKKWFFRVTAVAGIAQESLYSNMVSVNFIKPPGKARFITLDVR